MHLRNRWRFRSLTTCPRRKIPLQSHMLLLYAPARSILSHENDEHNRMLRFSKQKVSVRFSMRSIARHNIQRNSGIQLHLNPYSRQRLFGTEPARRRRLLR